MVFIVILMRTSLITNDVGDLLRAYLPSTHLFSEVDVGLQPGSPASLHVVFPYGLLRASS